MFQVTEILHGEDGKTCGAMCRDSNTGEIFQVLVLLRSETIFYTFECCKLKNVFVSTVYLIKGCKMNLSQVKAKSIINATGPFTDSIRKMDDEASESICSPSTGVHIVLPGYFR